MYKICLNKDDKDVARSAKPPLDKQILREMKNCFGSLVLLITAFYVTEISRT